MISRSQKRPHPGDDRGESSVMAAVDMQARVASLEQELSSVKAQADSDAINAEHQSQAMEARYNALEAEHSQVSGDFALPVSRPAPFTGVSRGSRHPS